MNSEAPPSGRLSRTALLLLSLLLMASLIGNQLEGRETVGPLLGSILVTGLLLVRLERRYSIQNHAKTLSPYLQTYQPRLEIFSDNRYFYIGDADGHGHLRYLSPSVRDVLGYQEMNSMPITASS